MEEIRPHPALVRSDSDTAEGSPAVKRSARAGPVRLLRSFYFAFAGLFFLFRTQRNARIHLALGAVACGLGAWLHITRVEWALLAFTIALVLILEGLNTAVEAAIDLASPDYH